MSTWMQTYTRRKFNPLEPDPALINELDIAHALSHICRFGGHTNEFYSVAQHSVIVSQCIESDLSGDVALCMIGLLHDASEAYIGDMIRPIKPFITGYGSIEYTLQNAIYNKFGLTPTIPQLAQLKCADESVLSAEAHSSRIMIGDIDNWRNRFPRPWPDVIIPMAPADVKQMWLSRFTELRLKLANERGNSE